MLQDLSRWLLNPAGLTPHGFCLLWQPGLIWTFMLSDGVIAAAYCSIPIVLFTFVRRRRDTTFGLLFWLFGSFILLCGVTHMLDVLTLWVPAYGALAIAKAATALVSVATAIMLWRLLPQALALPSPASLRDSNDRLRKTEAFLERTGEIARIGGFEHNLVTGELFWSAQTCRLLGETPGPTATPMDMLRFYTPQSRPVWQAAFERAVHGGEGWDLEVQCRRSDGHEFWARSVCTATSVDGRAVMLTGTLQDITDARAVRLQLAEAFERITLAAVAGRVGIWDWDLDSGRIIWDDWMYRLYGLDPDDGSVSFEWWTQYLHPDDRASMQTLIEDAVAGRESAGAEFRIVRDDGPIHHIRAAAKATFDVSGRAVRIIGTNWDVSETRMAAELIRRAEQLAEAAERERAMFTNSPDSLVIFRVEEADDLVDFYYEAVSPAHVLLTGIRTEDLIGRRPQDCLPADWGGAVMDRVRRCVQTGETIKYNSSFILPAGTRELEGSTTPIRSSVTGKIVRIVGSMRDVSERNRLEKALRGAQKMEAIGRLSAGVAHDFNNILQSIVGGLELALDDVAEETSAYEFMRISINAALRGASLTHHLLSYARQQILRPHTIEVRPFLAEVEVLLARTLGPHVVVRMSASPETSVLADAGQLETAILNLAINASHAMPQGGVLTIHARTEYEPDGPWVLIEVTDTGSGMDEATLAQATEPFFTTKGLGGSGLGLSMVHGFAEQSGGRMTIVSALGQGTTIALRLPSIAAIKHEEQPEAAARPAIGGRILVVDDAPDVLITTGAFLEKSGFTVVRAENGDRALALIAQSEHFDALVTDYAMPGLNGADLIIEARLIRPELKALIITGYTIGKHPVTLSTDIPVLNKPFKRADLIEAIHQLIDGEPARAGEAAVLTQSHEA